MLFTRSVAEHSPNLLKVANIHRFVTVTSKHNNEISIKDCTSIK